MCSEGYKYYTIINAEFSMQLIALTEQNNMCQYYAKIMVKLCQNYTQVYLHVTTCDTMLSCSFLGENIVTNIPCRQLAYFCDMSQLVTKVTYER